MILTIKSATLVTGSYGDYIKVIGVDGNGKEVTKNIGDKFKDKWDLLQENATVDIKMVQRDNKWRVDDIEPIKIEVDKTKITEQQKEVTYQGTPTTSTPPPPKASLSPPDLPYAKHPLTLAVEIACAKIQIGKEMTPSNILNLAEMFTLYLREGTSAEALKIYNALQKVMKGD